MPSQWQRKLKSVFFLISSKFSVIKAPTLLGTHMSLNEKFANIHELLLSPLPSIISQGQKNLKNGQSTIRINTWN